ncbi:MAG: MBG domain-containing protein [Treponema sp.]|nr:MBG domain-containing protein [Treponema sp.]
MMLVFLFFSCVPKESALEEAPIITSATYQYTQYNGRGQAVEVTAARDDAPPFVITYFTSEADLEQDRNGSAEPPEETGDYYARIERPAGNGYRQGNTIKVEYHIQKAFVSILADPIQRFSYDGRPKEITARTEPPQEPPLIISYTAAGTPLASPPAERGRYSVIAIFPGNDRYMGASKEVELRIE